MYYSEIRTEFMVSIYWQELPPREKYLVPSTYRYICTEENSVFKILIQTLQLDINACEHTLENNDKVKWVQRHIVDTHEMQSKACPHATFTYFMQHDHVQVGLARYQHKLNCMLT